MENSSYPELKEPQALPQMLPKMMPQQVPAYMPIGQPNDFEFRINWAMVFNVIVLIGEIVFLWAYGQYIAFVQDMQIYTFLVAYQVVLVIMNIVWYFYRTNSTFNNVLAILAYGTFVLFIGGILAVVILISGTMSQMVAVLVALLFILIPLGLLGLSVWLLLRNTFVVAQISMEYAHFFGQTAFDQEAPAMVKVQPQQQVRYVPVMVQHQMNSQFVKIPQ